MPGTLQYLRSQAQIGATNNITINVHSADPKAVVDAVKTYTKTNGKSNPFAPRN